MLALLVLPIVQLTPMMPVRVRVLAPSTAALRNLNVSRMLWQQQTKAKAEAKTDRMRVR